MFRVHPSKYESTIFSRANDVSHSKSHLTISESQAVFHGNLDIETLGGAGFASQRTIGDDRSWNLSDYEGITLTLGEADEKKYTFIIKDEILPPSSSGREKSTLSYEYDFSIASTETKGETEIFIAWKDLKATYRGKEKEDSPQLNNKNIKRFSIMMRRYATSLVYIWAILICEQLLRHPEGRFLIDDQICCGVEQTCRPDYDRITQGTRPLSLAREQDLESVSRSNISTCDTRSNSAGTESVADRHPKQFLVH